MGGKGIGTSCSAVYFKVTCNDLIKFSKFFKFQSFIIKEHILEKNVFLTKSMVKTKNFKTCTSGVILCFELEVQDSYFFQI